MTKSLIIFVLCGAATLYAQGGRRMGPVGPRERGVAVRTVTGAPFSGMEVTESSQTLANGNVISRKTESNVYRDSMGRVRTETTIRARGQSGQVAHTMVNIHDPVAGVTRQLNSATKTSREMYLPRNRGRGGYTATAATRAASTNPNVVMETLAMQTINGVQATGTRVTRTIPAGQIGNAQPIQVVHETWISPDLKMPVMEKDINPNSRTTVRQLTNITRSEPDPLLFQAPSDYKVIKGGRGRGAARQ